MSLKIPDRARTDDEPPKAERQALLFVRTWADEVLRQVVRVDEMRRDLDSAHRAADEDYAPSDWHMAELFRTRWAAEHTLLWAAFQLERWRRRLDRERDLKPRPADPQLKRVRDVLEHLDAADFYGDMAVAPALPENANKKQRRADPHRSLRDLGGLEIALLDDGTFCDVPSEELRSRALGIVHSVEQDLLDEAADHAVELYRGEAGY